MDSLLAKASSLLGHGWKNKLDNLDDDEQLDQIEQDLMQLAQQHGVELPTEGEDFEGEVEDDQRGYGDSEEEEEEEEEGMDSFDEDEDEDDLDNLDPKEQLRLLMEPVQNDFDEEDEDEDQEEEDEGEGAKDKKKKKRVLFKESDGEEEEEEEEVNERSMSNHEKRMAKLQATIAALERENVSDKPWALRGEVTAKARPQNSLLEEDVEFERNVKQAPIITESSTETLEALIKRRIMEQAFDDVVCPTDTQSSSSTKKAKRLLEDEHGVKTKSLNEVYEQEYQQKMSQLNGNNAPVPKLAPTVDPQTAAQHAEIRTLFGQLCHALDELGHHDQLLPKQYGLLEVQKQ